MKAHAILVLLVGCGSPAIVEPPPPVDAGTDASESADVGEPQEVSASDGATSADSGAPDASTGLDVVPWTFDAGHVDAGCSGCIVSLIGCGGEMGYPACCPLPATAPAYEPDGAPAGTIVCNLCPTQPSPPIPGLVEVCCVVPGC